MRLRDHERIDRADDDERIRDVLEHEARMGEVERSFLAARHSFPRIPIGRQQGCAEN